MLLPLIAILVLLVVGFYALWVGASGRVSGPESPELHLAGRALVVALALLAFGTAYVVYRMPQSREGLLPRAAATPPAAPAATPETRGSTAAESEAMMAESVKDDAEAAAASDDAKDEELTSTAALSEDEVRPRTRRELMEEMDLPKVKARNVVAAAKPEAVQARTIPAAKLASPASQTTVTEQVSKPLAKSRSTRSSRRGPLTMHVHNTLGRDQAYEQLTLSIEGMPVADFVVDEQNPAVAVRVPLPRPGLVHYRLEGLTDGYGTRTLVGEGCIRVSEGARFTVHRRPGSDRVFLQTRRAAR